MMEEAMVVNKGDDESLHLPPGFRFHPSDDEIITCYLVNKVLNSSFSAIAIGEADLNKSEPWDLPKKAKMGEKDWYFFWQRDKKYPTGMRTNRATQLGYWKATGKDREIFKGKTNQLIGMKKTLVFYKGRAPKGEKTNWVMHEFRLEGKFATYNLPKAAKDEWVVSRVSHKNNTTEVKRTPVASISSLLRINSIEDDYLLDFSSLPPLVDPSNTTIDNDFKSTNKTTPSSSDHNGHYHLLPPREVKETPAASISSPLRTNSIEDDYLLDFSSLPPLVDPSNNTIDNDFKSSNKTTPSSSSDHNGYYHLPPSFLINNNKNYAINQENLISNNIIPIERSNFSQPQNQIQNPSSSNMFSDYNIVGLESKQCKMGQFSTNNSVVSVSQDTCLSNDINTDTSSVASMGKNKTLYEDLEALSSIGPLSNFDYLWDDYSRIN